MGIVARIAIGIWGLSAHTASLARRLQYRRLALLAAGLGLILLGVNSCSTNKPTLKLQRHEFKSAHMGTMFSFTLYARDQDIAAKAAAAAVEEITRLDAMLTDYDPDSELMQLSRSPAGQPVAVSRDLFAVLFEAVRIARLSGGALDPTMGTVVRQWRRARRTAALPEEERLKEGWAQIFNWTLGASPKDMRLTALSKYWLNMASDRPWWLQAGISRWAIRLLVKPVGGYRSAPPFKSKEWIAPSCWRTRRFPPPAIRSNQW